MAVIVEKKLLSIKSVLSVTTAGLIIGLLTLIVEISFGTLIFSGAYAAHLSQGIGIMLAASVVVGVIFTITTTSPGMIARPHEIPAAILAVLAVGTASSYALVHPGSDPFPTLLGLIVASSIITGIVFLLMGFFRLGSFIRFIPYPVVGGFLAGTGWLLLLGGIGVVTGRKITIATLSQCGDPTVVPLCASGLVMGIILYAINRRFKAFWVMPLFLVVSIAVFWGVGFISGSDLSTIRAGGWLLPELGSGQLFDPSAVLSISKADWTVIIHQMPGIGTILVMSLIPLLLNASSFEMVAGRDVDINGELKAAGWASFGSAALGGPVGFHTLSLSALAVKMGAATRAVGFVAAGVCGLVLLAGPGFLVAFPRPVLGGMLAFQGISFLVEWVLEARRKLPLTDWLLVQIILIIIAVFGFLPGVIAGVCIALILFVVTYSRVDVVKYEVSGRDMRSNVDRASNDRQILDREGESTAVFKLQGFLFFGTGYLLLRHVRARAESQNDRPLKYLVLDFSDVSGMDTSALNSFVKMRQLAASLNFWIVLTGMPMSLRARFERDFDFSGDIVMIFKDSDHGLEWCENCLIDRMRGEGSSVSAIDINSIIGGIFHDKILEDRFMARLVRHEIPAGSYLMHEGDPPENLWFIESGNVTAKLARETGPSVRLRTMGPGTVVGELGFYLERNASASVKAETDAVAWALSVSELREMEQEDAAGAALFHRWVVGLLGERLTNTNGALRAMRD